jgi:hypothetical protein
MREIAQKHPFSTLDVDMRITLGALYRLVGDPEAALQTHRQVGGDLVRYEILNHHIALASILAAEILRACLEISQRSQLLLLYLKASLAMGRVCLRTGQFDETDRVANQTSEAAQRRLPEIDLQARLLKSALAWRAGRESEAAELARGAASEALEMEHLPLVLEALRQWAAVAQAEEVPIAAGKLSERIEKLCQQTNTPELRDRLTKLQTTGVDKTP